ncbi:MAG: hypothetical protein EOO53_03150 [Gammaproteobacteria bacterium]|nr:MAG: hypothetical protein EOO53_03150 [Gammaproteobacteria bacterium]
MQLSPNVSQVLAVIADIYTPVLLLMALFSVLSVRGNALKLQLAILIYAIFVVYLWMFIDIYTGLWALFALDYSTHSAIAFALAVVLGRKKSALYKASITLSLLLYGALMYSLNYHSWLDMSSTVAVISLSLLPLRLLRFISFNTHS